MATLNAVKYPLKVHHFNAGIYIVQTAFHKSFHPCYLNIKRGDYALCKKQNETN